MHLILSITTQHHKYLKLLTHNIYREKSEFKQNSNTVSDEIVDMRYKHHLNRLRETLN